MTLSVTENQGKLAETSQKRPLMGDAQSKPFRLVPPLGGVK